MQIPRHTHRALWLIISFVVRIGVFTGGRTFFSTLPVRSTPKNGTTATYLLLGTDNSIRDPYRPTKYESLVHSCRHVLVTGYQVIDTASLSVNVP